MQHNGNPLWDGLDRDEHLVALSYFEERSFDRDQTVIRQGALGDEMFVLEEGWAEVLLDDQVVAEIRDHEVFGEVCLVDPGVRSASVVAREALRVWVIDAAAFARLAHEHPRIALHLSLNLIRVLTERLRAADALVRLEREERLEAQAELESLAERPSFLGRLWRALNLGRS